MPADTATLQRLLNALPAEEGDRIEGALCYIGDTGDSGLGAGPDDVYEMMQRGRNWVHENVELLQRTICPNAVVKAFISSDDLLSAATALMALLPGLGEHKIVGIVILASRGALAQWCSQEA